MNKNRFTFGAIVAAAGILGGAMACSSSGGGGGSGTVTGTIGGTTLAVKDVISAKVSQGSGSDMQTFGIVFVANISGLCAEAMSHSNVEKKNSLGLIIQTANIDGTSGAVTAPTAAGTYTVFDTSGSGAPPPMAAIVQTIATDATCMTDQAKELGATTGTVTLTSVSGDVFAGTYDVTLSNGDHLTGKFTPEACPALNDAGSSDTGSGSGSGSAPVCQ